MMLVLWELRCEGINTVENKIILSKFECVGFNFRGAKEELNRVLMYERVVIGHIEEYKI